MNRRRWTDGRLGSLALALVLAFRGVDKAVALSERWAEDWQLRGRPGE